MARWSPRAVLDWLRAGYPEGIPAKDHFALLAVLQRRLTDEEILEAIDTAAATAAEHPDRHVDHDTLRRIVAGLIHEEPTPEDIERVRERLIAAGWPVVGDELSRGDVEEPPVSGTPDDDPGVSPGSVGDAPRDNR
ncbi:DUF3349 domain-containing protein [Rhodococcus sp. CC-R104]|uniref:DUF3349 domain-containing protein n=1 Tax=Rhodococcus chondri TaxID=3065941 RepID=A0ABU7K033_9NOCA|nr:DUF3349 domain-containing protein [Rhodococcus sp. CC-R104]MEE2035529.1 DUF3349 domain-containing protein [Rhodococcus sp. CC-R104]